MTFNIKLLLPLFLILSLLPSPVASQFQEDVGVRQNQDDDLIFTQHLLWATGRRSVASCATTCMNDQQCVSFTFPLTRNASKGQGECRGHSAVDEAGDGQRSAGSRRYVLRARAHAVSSLLTTTEEPATTTSVLDLTTSLVTTTEESVAISVPDTTTSLLTTTEEPVTTTSLMATTEEPVVTSVRDTTTSPMTTTEEPVTTTSLMTTTEEPVTTTSLMTTTEEPVTTSTNLLTTTEEPVTTSTSLVTTTEEPVVTTVANLPTTTAKTNADWLSKACDDDAQCPVPNSECFADLCLCTPGYYYSVTTATCLYSCPSTDLLDTFLIYPGYMISEYMIDSNGPYSNYDLAQCKTKCISYANHLCRSFDFSQSLAMCGPSHVAVNDVAESYWKALVRFVYGQRKCR